MLFCTDLELNPIIFNMDTTLDFFISYTQKDRQMAEWIAWELEEAGHSVLIQAWDIPPGKSFPKEMQNAATNAKRTIALLSKAYLDSRFAMDECYAAYVKDALLPLKVTPVSLTGIMATYVHEDFVGIDEDSAREKLLMHCPPNVSHDKGTPRSQQKRYKPKVKPRFPEYPTTRLQPLTDKPLYAIGYLNRDNEWNDHIVTRLEELDNSAYTAQETSQNNTTVSPGKTCAFVLTGVNEEWPETLEYRLRIEKGIPEQRVIRIRPGKLSTDNKKNEKLFAKELWDRINGNKSSPALKSSQNIQHISDETQLIAFLNTKDSYLFVWRLAPKLEHYDTEKLSQLLNYWHQLNLNTDSKVHYLLVLYDQVKRGLFKRGEKKVGIWRQQLVDQLPTVSLPPLRSPDWEDIDFWLEEHLRAAGISQHKGLRARLEKKRPIKKLFNKNIGLPMKTIYEQFELILSQPGKPSK